MQHCRLWRGLMTALCVVVLIVGLNGCAKRRAPESLMDTPEHHVYNGNKSFEQGNLEDAEREYGLALELDPKYGPAHVGMGLVLGTKQARAKDEKARKKLYKEAFASLKRGKKYAKGDDQKILAYVGYIRVHALTRGDDWLEEAREAFDYAAAIDESAPAPYYYMGEAYKLAYEFDAAANMYRKVLELDKEFSAEANKSWELVQKIQRAAPGTSVGKKIALVESISRADVAALFMQELRLDEIYEKLSVKTFDTSYSAPKSGLEMETATVVKLPAATDIDNHVLRHDIEGIIRIGVRGLEPYPNHTFKPDEKITRAAFALMLEDILVKATHDDKLATKFIGSSSPFPDLRNDLPYFNAVMVCTTRGILKPVDVRSGEFRPMAPVSGADALLAIRMLKEQLKLL